MLKFDLNLVFIINQKRELLDPRAFDDDKNKVRMSNNI